MLGHTGNPIKPSFASYHWGRKTRGIWDIQKSSHLQPLAATRVAASGRKWPQVAARASGRKWPQVAASGRYRGRKWPHVAARGRLLYLVGPIWNFQSSVTCSHLHYLQPLAATCSHSSGRKWPQVAASGRKWPQVAASGCKWPQVAAWTANTSPNGPSLENLKKILFSRTACFQVFCETWGESWNERKEITNRREELKRKDGRNEMDELKVPCLIFRSLLLPIPFKSSCRFNSSRSLRLSFRFTFSLLCVTYFRPLVSSLISRSFLLPFRFNSSLPFAPSFLLI